MSTLIFTLKSNVTHPVDCRVLAPDNLKGKTLDEIKVLHLNKQHQVKDMFDVAGESADHIVFKTSSATASSYWLSNEIRANHH